MSLATLTSLLEKDCGDLFFEFKAHPQLIGFITNGVPVAIAGYLQSKMADSGDEEVSLDIKNKSGVVTNFKLTAVKKGDSVAFTPSFELGSAGQDLVDSDSIDFDSEAFCAMAIEIAKNEEFVKAARNAFMSKIYSDGEWIDDTNCPNNATTRGLTFDEESDIAICVAIYIYNIIKILCNFKAAEADIEYEVPALGKYKVSPTKSGYAVSLTFDKAFKGNCKSDKLAEKMAAA